MKRWFFIAGFLTIAPAIAFSQGSYLNILGIIRGDSAGAQFGKKVVPAGDTNGDTLPDFLVLATGSQKVYLFHGKKGGLDTLPDLFFEHKAQLNGLGDLNSDGGLDFGMRESGQALQMSIYFGGLCLDTIRNGFVKGESSGIFGGDGFGGFFSAGKLSGIGNSQIVSGTTDKGFDSTRFYFFNMALSSIDSLPFKTLDLERREGHGAGPSEILGDINGDGFSDLAIGRTATTLPGRVEIFFGGTSFDTIPDIVLNPPSYLTPGDATAFGSKLSSVGDLNNDGLSEFVVGVSRTPLLYFGGNPFDTLPRFTLDRIGDHFVNGGDINHDGYDDLLVGRDEFPITGFAYVYYGGTAMDSVVDLFINETDLPFNARGFGQTVAGLGDIDGDGSSDFAVGSTSNTNPDRGYLWLFKGLLPPTGIDDKKLNLPKNFTLEQNYPNPFNANTIISFRLNRRNWVKLEIFNIAGQKIKVLLNQEKLGGSHQVVWDGIDSTGRPVSSGIYFYKLQAGDESETKKMTLVR